MTTTTTMKRSLQVLSLATATALTATLTVSPAAHASAERTVGILLDGVTVDVKGVSVGVPRGTFTFKIDGGDRWVGSIGGSFHSPVPIANWKVRVLFFGLDGKVYHSFDGKTHTSQNHNGNWYFPINREMPYGKVCGLLLSNGQPLKTGVCHNITAPYVVMQDDSAYKAGQKVGGWIRSLNPFN